MGALTKFDISTNTLYAAGAKALLKGLKGNQVMTEFNLAGNELCKAPGNFFGTNADMSGIIALASIIPSMGALSKLDARDNTIPPAKKALLQGACDANGVSLRVSKGGGPLVSWGI
jgi:hypothetical protein